jgi:hypothetical protein
MSLIRFISRLCRVFDQNLAENYFGVTIFLRLWAGTLHSFEGSEVAEPHLRDDRDEL